MEPLAPRLCKTRCLLCQPTCDVTVVLFVPLPSDSALRLWRDSQASVSLYQVSVGLGSNRKCFLRKTQKLLDHIFKREVWAKELSTRFMFCDFNLRVFGQITTYQVQIHDKIRCSFSLALKKNLTNHRYLSFEPWCLDSQSQKVVIVRNRSKQTATRALPVTLCFNFFLYHQWQEHRGDVIGMCVFRGPCPQDFEIIYVAINFK